MGVCRALALFGNAKQGMGEGKSGPVETGLTGPAATALYQTIIIALWTINCFMHITAELHIYTHLITVISCENVTYI